jgi:anti-sigma factor RsiW
MNTQSNTVERDEVEALLPWHAAGTLNRKDTQRVERALANDRELARRYDLVREELASTIELNETLGAPSARAMAKLMAAIEAEAPAKRAGFDLAARVSEFLSGFSPRTLAWSASAAAVALMLQAGIIAGVLISPRGPGGFETASYGQPAPAVGSFVLVRFAPQASAADITRFMEANQASIVDGPKAGMYRIRVAATPLDKDELDRVIKRLQEDKAVGLVAPSN